MFLLNPRHTVGTRIDYEHIGLGFIPYSDLPNSVGAYRIKMIVSLA